MKRMSTSKISFVVIITMSSRCNAGPIEQMQELYRNISQDLVDIRKEYVGAQPKVYSLLDQVDKMYTLAKKAVQGSSDQKKDMQNKHSEVVALKSENNNLKKELESSRQALDVTKGSLDATFKKLESEQAHVKQASREKEDLIKQIGSLALAQKKNRERAEKATIETVQNDVQLQGLVDDQSFNRTSTSEPSSPR
jgi:chromosome segregation ATPase